MAAQLRKRLSGGLAFQHYFLVLARRVRLEFLPRGREDPNPLLVGRDEILLKKPPREGSKIVWKFASVFGRRGRKSKVTAYQARPDPIS